MDKEQVLLYKERWRAVNEFVNQERRAATPEQRLNQVNAIYRLAIGLGLVEKAKRARSREASNWTRIKEILEVL